MNRLVKIVLSREVILLYILVSVIETYLILYSRDLFSVVYGDFLKILSSPNPLHAINVFLKTNLSRIVLLLTFAYAISMIYWTYFSLLKTYVYYKYFNQVKQMRAELGRILFSIIKFFFFWNSITYLIVVAQILFLSYVFTHPTWYLLSFVGLGLIVSQILIVWIFLIKLNSSVAVGIENLGIWDLKQIESFVSQRLAMFDLLYLATFFLLESYDVNLLISFLIILLFNLLIAVLLVNEYINYRKKAQSS